MSSLQRADFEKIVKTINGKNRILLITHKNPDGDAIGSLLAMYGALLKTDKQVSAICQDEIPDRYHFLKYADVAGQEFSTLDLLVKIDCQNTVVDKVSYNITDNVLNLVVTPTEGKFEFDQVSLSYGKPNFDLIITLDTPELHMLGSLYEAHKEFFHQTTIVNIDHHVSNQNYGNLNLVDDKAPSTGEVLYHLFEQTGMPIDPPMATSLLTAIITDTGSFQHASTTADSFSVSGKLMERGGDLQNVIENVYRRKSVSMLKLWGRILSRIQQDEANRLVWVSVGEEDFRDTNAKEEEAVAALNDLIVGIPDVDAAIMLYQYPDRPVRGSLRTSPRLNASSLAEMFGGGGHPPAAGFILHNADLADAEKNVIEKIRTYIRENGTIEPSKQEQPRSSMTPEEIINKIGQMMDADLTEPVPNAPVEPKAEQPAEPQADTQEAPVPQEENAKSE